MKISETLFFTGHRNVYFPKGSEPFAVLKELLLSFIDKGYTDFITGGALGFDTMAAECVIDLKESGKPIRLHVFAPCRNQSAPWGERDRFRYEVILKCADDVRFIRDEYTRFCMFERNRAMADLSSACIAYCNSNEGGTAYTVNYAANKNIPVVNLANSF